MRLKSSAMFIGEGVKISNSVKQIRSHPVGADGARGRAEYQR